MQLNFGLRPRFLSDLKKLVFRHASLKTGFAFYLLPFILLLLASLSACRSNPNMQTPGESYLQGEWQQDPMPGQKRLLSYALYHFKFSCDSFFVAVNSFSKVNTGADSCMSSGHWHEYIRGTYQQLNDTLHLKGQYANADYTVKDDKGCFRSGDYEEFFKVVKTSGKSIKLLSTSNVIPINARLVEKLTCHLKPL